MTKSEIINFLIEKPGYLKEGKNRLALLLEDRGEDVTVEDCEFALKEAKKLKDNNLTLKTTWVTPEGNVGYSYKTNEQYSLNEITKRIQNSISKEKIEISKKEVSADEITVALADLHIGSFVRLLKNSPDYDITVVRKALSTVAHNINVMQSKKVNVIILGDLIESFTGMNHPNSWQQIELYGADLVVIAYELLIEFFEKIINLNSITLISGNHDRYTSSNKEDVQGGISKILYYFIKKAIPDVLITWDSLIHSQENNGIVFNSIHGHFRISKNPPSDIILRYSVNKDVFNLILEGHWHSRRKKQPINNKAVNWDSKTYRMYTVPSIFSGNFYSESEGYSSTPGFMIFWNNGEGLPITLDIPLNYA